MNSVSSVPKRNRSRKAIFYNPPFSKDVKTNVGQKFLQIMDKHFPKGSPLNKIFNRNGVKMSYRCTANLGQKISAHNAKILKVSTVQEVDPKTCNCRNRNLCPLENKTGGLSISPPLRQETPKCFWALQIHLET